MNTNHYNSIRPPGKFDQPFSFYSHPGREFDIQEASHISWIKKIWFKGSYRTFFWWFSRVSKIWLCLSFIKAGGEYENQTISSHSNISVRRRVMSKQDSQYKVGKSLVANKSVLESFQIFIWFMFRIFIASPHYQTLQHPSALVLVLSSQLWDLVTDWQSARLVGAAVRDWKQVEGLKVIKGTDQPQDKLSIDISKCLTKVRPFQWITMRSKVFLWFYLTYFLK